MKHLFLFLPVTLLLLSISACKKEQTAIESRSTETLIKWQECVDVQDQGLKICFLGANEYRCGCNENCIWEGAIDATLRITNNNGLDTTIVLTTNSSPQNLPHKAVIAGKTIDFISTNITDCNQLGHYNLYEIKLIVE